jgi:hypothetical protein
MQCIESHFRQYAPSVCFAGVALSKCEPWGGALRESEAFYLLPFSFKKYCLAFAAVAVWLMQRTVMTLTAALHVPDSCYTESQAMRSPRKGVFLLIAIVALWTVMPAFACVQRMPVRRACCGLMRDCHLPTSMNAKKCCVARPQAELVQPATPGSDEGGACLTTVAAAPELTEPLRSRACAVPSSEDSPPGQVSGAPFVLRI